MYDPKEFLELAEKHLKDTNSSYNLFSIQCVIHVIHRLLEDNNKISGQDIIFLTPGAILKEFGYLWNIVLKKSNIFGWDDFGRVIYICIDLGVFKESEEDNLDQFLNQELEFPLIDNCNLLETDGFITSQISFR